MHSPDFFSSFTAKLHTHALPSGVPGRQRLLGVTAKDVGGVGGTSIGRRLPTSVELGKQLGLDPTQPVKVGVHYFPTDFGTQENRTLFTRMTSIALHYAAC